MRIICVTYIVLKYTLYTRQEEKAMFFNILVTSVYVSIFHPKLCIVVERPCITVINRHYANTLANV